MGKQPDRVSGRRGVAVMPVLAGCCGLAAIVGLGLWATERSHERSLDLDRAQTAVALDTAKLQIKDLTDRLNALAEKTAEQPRPVRAVPRTDTPRRTAASTSRARAPRAPAVDPRVEKLQGELADTQKELASTRDQLNQDKDELNGRIDSTRDDLNSARDDLNGSIAKTHDEVVALQKRGEQNIYEFKLTQSKQMQRVGPISLALRSTSVKNRTYDLSMLVDDNALNKKHINLYEPVWITLGDRPVQLVVNHLEKKEIEGYISEPKYSKSDLSADSNQPSQLTSKN